MRDILFIINPVAGNGSGIEYIEKIKKSMKLRDINYEIYISTSKSSIGEYLTNKKGEFSKIVGIGGDGTINDIINYIDINNTILGIVPLGSGNDFLRNFKKEFSFDKMINNIIEEKYEEYDLWEANGRKFINVFSIGVDGEILISRSNRKRSTKGKYLLMALKKLIMYRTKNVVVKIDDKCISRNIYLCSVCNGKFFGSGMEIMPKADLKDGLLDICIINTCMMLKILFLFPSIYWGGHLRFKGIVEHYRGSNIEIITDKEIPLDLDGEIIGSTPAKITKSEKMVKIVKHW